MAAPIILVHGAFCGGWAFNAFKAPLEAAGHRCTAIDLPGRISPAGFSMNDFARAVSEAAEQCDEAPFLIGHSLGGLVAQMAAARRPVQGVMMLAPAAPWGIAARSMEEASISLGLLSLGAPWAQSIPPNRDLFEAYSVDRVEREARRLILGRMGSESGRALWETFNWWLDPFMTTQVPSNAIAAPCLAIAGEKDRICPPASVAQVGERIGAETMVMPGMSHWLIGEPGWEDVTRLCLEWMRRSVREAA